MFLSMALVWHYVALRFALNRRARFRSPRGGLLEQAGGPTWPNRGGLLGQVGGCRGPSLTFGWVERLFTRPRLGGSQVLHSPLGGLKGYSLIPGCEFKSLSFSPGESQVLHSPWVGYKVHSPRGENTLGSGTGVCEIKAVLANLTMSFQPPPPLFQCWRACLCECKAVRNKSRVLREDGAEQGNVELGEMGCPRKPERANLFERLLLRKHRNQIWSPLS